MVNQRHAEKQDEDLMACMCTNGLGYVEGPAPAKTPSVTKHMPRSLLAVTQGRQSEGRKRAACESRSAWGEGYRSQNIQHALYYHILLTFLYPYSLIISKTSIHLPHGKVRRNTLL